MIDFLIPLAGRPKVELRVGSPFTGSDKGEEVAVVAGLEEEVGVPVVRLPGAAVPVAAEVVAEMEDMAEVGVALVVASVKAEVVAVMEDVAAVGMTPEVACSEAGVPAPVVAVAVAGAKALRRSAERRRLARRKVEERTAVAASMVVWQAYKPVRSRVSKDGLGVLVEAPEEMLTERGIPETILVLAKGSGELVGTPGKESDNDPDEVDG